MATNESSDVVARTNPEKVNGVGWKWPVEITRSGVALADTSVDDVRQSLRFLFNTMPGERLMRPDFGCDLNQFMFENYSKALVSTIKDTITASVGRYETRIKIDDINIDLASSAPVRLNIHINYHLLGSMELQAISGEMGGAQGTIRF